MKPYYERDGIVIYNCPCGEWLSAAGEGAVDITMTSPPYNTLPQNHKPSGLHGQRKSGVNQWIMRASQGYDDNMPEDEYQQWLHGVVAECIRVSRGLVWVNHKIRYRDGEALHPVRFLPFPVYSEVVWNRRVSMALNCKRFAPSHEHLWAFGAPHFWSDENNTLMSVWDIAFDRTPNEHPCAYPVDLASRPILSSCPVGGTVFDPFGGSGTTGIAAYRAGRKAVLTEKREDYCEMGAARLDREISQGRLFTPAAVVEKQAELFGEPA